MVQLITKRRKLSVKWNANLFKESEKKLKIVQLVNKRRKLSVQWTAKLLKGF